MRRLIGPRLVWMSLLMAAAVAVPLSIGSPAVAQGAVASTAQGAPTQPMTTGSPSQKMDAPEANTEMEGYRHSSTVQALARVLHVPVERAAQIFEDFNSGLLILVILYFLVKFLPRAFRKRRETIDRGLTEAQMATAEAYQRLQLVEARLGALDTEIEEIRRHAAHDSEGDQKRIEASLEAERARIVRSAEREISAAQAAAERDLKRFAADLAVDRAISRIELSADADRVLVNELTEGLAGVLHSEDFRKRGQN